MSRNNAIINSPPGKKVEFYNSDYTGNVFDSLTPKPQSDLLLAEEIQLSLSSQFGSIVPNEANVLASVFSSAFKIPAIGTSKAFGFQAWKGTDPLKTSFSVALHRVSNAEFDVWKPAKLLMNLPLPVESEASAGDFAVRGLLKAPGPSVLDVINETVDTPISSKNAIGKKSKLGLRIGSYIDLDFVLVSRVEPVFSTEVDDTGYPIYCKLTIDISSVYTATTDLIDRM